MIGREGMTCAYCNEHHSQDAFVSLISAQCWRCWLYERARDKSSWRGLRKEAIREYEARRTPHAYETTWDAQTDPDGPFRGALGPDLSKPCLVCGKPFQDHRDMKLPQDRATTEKQRGAS